MTTTLELAPCQVMQAFHVRPIEIDGGNAADFVDTACKLYLLWQSDYTDYRPTLRIEGRPKEARILNMALFGH